MASEVIIRPTVHVPVLLPVIRYGWVVGLRHEIELLVREVGQTGCRVCAHT